MYKSWWLHSIFPVVSFMPNSTTLTKVKVLAKTVKPFFLKMLFDLLPAVQFFKIDWKLEIKHHIQLIVSR